MIILKKNRAHSPLAVVGGLWLSYRNSGPLGKHLSIDLCGEKGNYRLSIDYASMRSLIEQATHYMDKNSETKE